MLRFLPLLLAVGCEAPQPQEAGLQPMAQERPGGCGAERASGLVGRTRSPTVEDEVRRLSGAATIRWIAPGTMVTMDYRSDRLDVHLDGGGRILKFDCG